jgi:hydroxyacylglutathione hydrolase
LFQSLQRLAPLPDHLQIWPGHGAGSACGKALGAMPSSTLGYERRTNWAFGVSSEDAFVAAVLEGQPNPPRYFARMKRVNREGPAILGPPAPLPEHQATEGLPARLLDIRSKQEFAAGHHAGSLLIPLGKAFTTWAGWLLEYDTPIALVANAQAEADDAARALRSIGFDLVSGWYRADAVRTASGSAWTTARQGDIAAATDMLADGRRVIDLREQHEWEAGHIPGAELHPLGTVASSLAELDRDTPVAIHCQGGTRSAIGASVLEGMGFTDVVDLEAGFGRWPGPRVPAGA